MLSAFTKTTTSPAVPIHILTKADLPIWLDQQDDFTKSWVASIKFGQTNHESPLLIADTSGELKQVLVLAQHYDDFWVTAGLAMHLPQGVYQFVTELNHKYWQQWALAWGLGAYQFTRYKKPQRAPAQLLLPENISTQSLFEMLQATYLIRDLINTPASDMNPHTMQQAAAELAQEFNATFRAIVGDELLQQNYPMIHAVGRASQYAPRLLDLRWGNPQHPKLTLVGKGVSFDTGGLDLKDSKGMLLMKKDMGGAAHVLGLARLIMATGLPVRLRVLISAVENAVSGNAYRPGDIVTTRKGLTVEVNNTDAEGRLILCDALAEAGSEKPDLLIDFATLTGAARVAVGTEISALFTPNDELALSLERHGQQQSDPIWRLPLYAGYRRLLDSHCADLSNVASHPYAGAIVAGLFLQEFVPNDVTWAHFDLMAWNMSSRPGRPEGGEAMALRAVYSYLQERFT